MGDPLGDLSLSAEDIIARDHIVFDLCRGQPEVGSAIEGKDIEVRGAQHDALARTEASHGWKYPVVMLFSGGYQRINASVIARSIQSLDETFQLFSER